jgi:ATP-binding cassette subfamily C protein CydD
LEIVGTLSTAIIAVQATLRLLSGAMAFQPALFILILAPEFYLPLRLLGQRFHAAAAGTSAAARLFEILGQPAPKAVPAARASSQWTDGVERHLDRNPSRATVDSGTGDFIRARDRQATVRAVADSAVRPPGVRSRQPLRRAIVFDDVHFAYEGGRRPALRGCSFEIPAGKMVALAGLSGAGKSTAANLLLGFGQPDRGQILIDGVPLSELSLVEWRQQVAWVPQAPHLFHDTLAANIRLARPEATLAEVMRAAERAQLHEFIASLPQGYETSVGEQGLRLSGGQAQRVALARAFLKDAPVLILDEPTSSVDPALETQLALATRALMRGRTVLVIAHRLTTIRQADHVVVLEAGRVVEEGQAAELWRDETRYRELVNASQVER